MSSSSLSTVQPQLLSAIKALGIDGRSAIREGELDPIVYLLDQAGAGFGYRFEWERYGPFSEELAADVAELGPDEEEWADELDGRRRSAVDRVRGIIEPSLPGLPELTWIRLLASVHFLRRFAGLSLSNGDRPPYLQAPQFEQPMVAAAVERIAPLEQDLAG